MSPIHSFDLSNFSDTPNEVLETHSPYMFSTEQQNTPSPNTSPSSGEDGGGGGVVDAEQSQAIKKIKLEMEDEDERREIKTEPKCVNETEADDARTANECNDADESSSRSRPLESGSRRSSGHDVHDSSKQFEILLSGSDNLVDSQIARGDLNAVGDDQFEIDTNHSTMNFDCFGTVNDDVMESAFDEGVLGGVDCEKTSAKNAESGVEQRRRDADNSDDDDSGDDSDDSSENDDDSSDSDDTDDESNTPTDDVSKVNTSVAAAPTVKMEAESESGNDKKDEKNAMPAQKQHIDANEDGSRWVDVSGAEAKRTKEGDSNGGDVQDGSMAKNFDVSTESVAISEGAVKNTANEVSERNQGDGNENSNHSAASLVSNANANHDSNDGNKTEPTSGNAAASAELASTNDEKKGVEENSERIGDKAKGHSEMLKMPMDSKRIKSEPNSRNISPQHRSDGGNGNHSADELLMGTKEKSAAKMAIATAELRKNAGASSGVDSAKTEQSGATRNLLDAAMDILRDTDDEKDSGNFGVSSDAADVLESGTHLGDSPGINLDDSVNLESLDAVANLLSTDLDLDSDDNHDIFGALDNDQLDSISDSNSEDGIGHSTAKDVKSENLDSIDDKVVKKESDVTSTSGATTVDESKNNSMDAKPLSCLEYKSWTSETPANVAVCSEASSANVKTETVATANTGETVDKASAIDVLVNAPLLSTIKQELDCNEAMSNDTEEDSNGNDFHAALELELKRRQSPENALEKSIVKIENEIEVKEESYSAASAAVGAAADGGEMITKSNSIEKVRRNEKLEGTTTNEDKSDRNNNSGKNRKGRKRARPQFHEPTILRPSAPFNFDCLANRPTLRSHNYESLTDEDIGELTPCTLYDYSTLEAWMNHPVKRFKPNEKPVHQLTVAQAALKVKPELQELYTRQNVVMANWTTAISNNNNETKPLPGATGSADAVNTDTQSDYDDEDSNPETELSPSNLSELSAYGNIDILDPEDLDCFSEDFVHVSYNRGLQFSELV